MRCQIVVELATNHGGDLALACDMIHEAAEAGADWVKTQAYQIQHLRPSDPQYAWFKQCALTLYQHQTLKAHAEACGVGYLTTAFHRDDLALVKDLGLTAVKVGSGEGRTELVKQAKAIFPTVYATLPWGQGPVVSGVTYLSTVPLYPAPAECFYRVKVHQGYSDHHEGIDVAKIAIAKGVQVLEKHFQIPGRGRNQSHNMTADDVRELRRWAEVCALANSGTRWEGRWTA